MPNYAREAHPNPKRPEVDNMAKGEYVVLLDRKVFGRKKGQTFLAEEVNLTKGALAALVEAGLVEAVVVKKAPAKETKK